MQKITDVRTAVLQGYDLADLLFLRVDDLTVYLEQDVERFRQSQPLVSSLSYHGILSASGKHPLLGLKSVLFFDDRDWWPKLKERAGVIDGCQAIGKLSCSAQRGTKPDTAETSVEIGVAVTAAQLMELYEATKTIVTRTSHLIFTINLDLKMPERDPAGNDLECLWVRAVLMEVHWSMSAPEVRRG